ncbi:transmembrane channel-like protein 5 isoform X2 [Castor canadensis]|uniref:Transmembrane channel-like protein 5 isoform X2 n=1 Tax=Castor canadensis TaxID=51338 RepID=A0AC58LES7_CASCN
MAAHYRKDSYEDDAHYPDYLGSRSPSQGYSKPQVYSQFPGLLNNLGRPSPRSNPYAAGSRTNPDYPGALAEPDYPKSPSNPDYPNPRNTPNSADSRTGADYPGSLPEPDYRDLPSNAYRSGSPGEPDYPGAFAGSRTNSVYLGPLGEPDYPGAQGDSSHPSPRATSNHRGSRRNVGYGGFSINPYADSPEEPHYPGAVRPPNSPRFFGKADYPGADGHQNSPNFWGEPDYPGAEDGRDCGSSETPEMARRGDGPLGILGRENEDFPESIEMTSRDMASPYSRSLPGTPGNGYVNPAYVGESTPGCDYGNPPLSECDWHKSPEGQKLIASLISMTFRDRIKTIRSQPKTMEEKRKLRNIVDREKSKQSYHTFEINYCAQCLSSISLAYRRSKNSLSELLDSISLWQKTLKVIGGKFGTSVLSYFNFLRWLLKFNVFFFVVIFSFIVIPQFTVANSNTVRFTGLEFFTGAGYFGNTVMYYGFYTNSTIQHRNSGASYNMQLAYIFTIGVCLVICFFILLSSMAKYFRNNFINPHIYSRGIAKLVFCWDFTVTHDKAVRLKQKNLSTEIRENLSEIRQENVKFTFHQRLTRFSVHVMAWLVSTGVAVACCAAVYYLAEYNSEFLKAHKNPGAVLLLPFVVSCINLAVPRFYSMFRLVEWYEMPRHEVYALLIRNIFLKISIIGVLCYYWLNIVAPSGEQCWETFIGQEIYRLLLMDFVFSLADSLLGEFLRRLGIFFCPLLPLIQMLNLFIMFYVKNISLMMTFQPPSKAWRASQMMTLFIFLLFFPSFTGVLCTLAITIWRLQPSADCGPFQGLPSFIQSIYSWIDTLSKNPGYLWVVWIYRNLIGSVHFFFILTLIVLIITYLYWQITEGRKVMIRLLHEQIVNEGKDKMFLIEKLIKLQDMEKKANPSALILESRETEQQGPWRLGEHDVSPDLRFRRSVQEENPKA